MNSASADSRGSARVMHNPIFLLAPPRSYSTVSLALLAGHPDVYGFPEMLIFRTATVGGLLSGAGRQMPDAGVRYGRAGVVRAVAQVNEGSQSPIALRRAREWLSIRADWSTVSLMNHLFMLVHPKIGIEKSPETVISSDALAACLRAYPQARYIHLTRHPVTSLRSMLRHYSHWVPPGEEEPLEVRARAHLMLWYASHLRIVKALAALPADQWMRLRAEDLLGEPRARLPEVLDWLGLRCDTQTVSLMMHTERWEFADKKRGSTYGGGDPIFMNNPVLRPVPPPPPELTPRSCELSDDISRRIAALANYLGY
jgi:Sulfotransferase family